MSQKILRASDVKERLGIGINTAYKLIGRPDFPKIRIGHNYFIPEDSFNAWIQKSIGKEYVLPP